MPPCLSDPRPFSRSLTLCDWLTHVLERLPVNAGFGLGLLCYFAVFRIVNVQAQPVCTRNKAHTRKESTQAASDVSHRLRKSHETSG